MVDQLSEKEKSKFLFSYLVMSYQTAALMHLGQLKDPLTQKISKDLEKAKLSIDILVMLLEKTKSNLSRDETDLLNNVLRELRLAYVKESEKKS